MPFPFTGTKMFWAGPNFCARPKIYLHFVSVTNILCQTKRQFAFMPCPFTGSKMFWAGPNFLCQTKRLFTYCSSHKHFVPDKKMICIQ